jgi:hypothetical protein
MDPKLITIATSPVLADLNLQCTSCQTIFLKMENKGEAFTVFDIVRASLRHSCAN